MFNRRVLRTKVLQVLYASYKKDDNSLKKAENELNFSIQRSYGLLFFLTLLLEDVTAFAQKITDIRKDKKFATPEEKTPSLKFINNSITKLLTENEKYIKYINESKLSWDNYPELVRKVYNILEKSEVFDIYMNKKDDNFRNDKRIIQFFYSEILYNCKELYSALEEQSIFWISDIDFVITKLTHIIDNIKKDREETVKFPEIYKQDDDKDFVINLLRNTLIYTEDYTEIIKNKVVNWDVERIADTDKIILLTAISEIIKFPSIPVKVTFNEYIEIAKTFGSEKSGGFINGILDKIIKYLETENLYKKIGRGLLDNKTE
ncbi:MAG: transcription antitermination factor NusB [Bacteroidales bacterium]|nr:transcription antitermination factor NusB [Bacteroidales bacterium]